MKDMDTADMATKGKSVMRITFHLDSTLILEWTFESTDSA